MTKRTFTVHTYENGQQKTEVFEMSDEMARIVDESASWFQKQKAKCETGDFDSCIYKSDSAYYDDGDNPECSKHCWACRRCGAIIQVG